VARNWRCSIGELDLVVQRGGLLVFCEVKSRRGGAFGGGYEAVGWRKRRKVRQLAEVFLADTGARPAAIRFDVASVDLGSIRGSSVEIFEDAF
jgi:putative endonuclease